MPVSFFQNPGPPAKEIEKVSKSKIIFVEGQDECLLLDFLLTQMGADSEKIQIIPYGGKEKFELNLDALLRQDAFLDDEVTLLAVLQDADASGAKTQASISAIMLAKGLPDTPFGDFKTGKKFGGLQYGAYMFPDNSQEGNLESLLMESVGDLESAKDACVYVDKYVDSSDKDNAKRKAQVYLAVQSTLCRGAGRGARDGYFKLDHTVLSELREFLQKIKDA